MHVALIADTAYLEEDAAAFGLLSAGLQGEGLRVTQVVPAGAAIAVEGEKEKVKGGGESPGAGAPPGASAQVTWQDSDWAIVRKKRLAALAPELERLEVDLIHAFSARLWRAARSLVEWLQVPAVLECSSLRQLEALDEVRAVAQAGRVAFAAATQPLAKAITDHLGAEAIVRLIRPGVVLPAEPGPIPRTPDARCLLIHGDGAVDEDHDALFDALRGVVAQHPQVQLFLDNPGKDGHDLWQAAHRCELLPWLNLVPRRLGRRELLLAADLFVQPQALGGVHALTLAAMAHGLPVMARQDARVDYLVADQTAWLVERPEAAAWAGLLGPFLADPSAGRELGVRAREWVGQNHRTGQQVAQTVTLYRQVTGAALPFPAAKG